MATSIDLKKRTTSTTTMELAPDIPGILKDSDLATVPASPTDAMIEAGIAASGATAEQARAVYRAMLKASASDGELRLKLHTPKGTA
jgi:hypothetical protein